MKKFLTLLALFGPLASGVLATCDPPGPPAEQMTYPSCAGYGVTIPGTGEYQNTNEIYSWSCCDMNQVCTANDYNRFHRHYCLYANEGGIECYDTAHTYTDYGMYGCCRPDVSGDPGDPRGPKG